MSVNGMRQLQLKIFQRINFLNIFIKLIIYLIFNLLIVVSHISSLLGKIC